MNNFTLCDFWQTTLATIAYSLFLLPIGFVVGSLSDCLGFRSRSAAEKLLFSTAFSIASTPILVTLLTRFLSLPGALIVFLLMAMVPVATLIRSLPFASGWQFRARRSTWAWIGFAVVWFVVVQLSVADLQMGHRLYVSYLAYDYSIRVPLVEAVVRTGVPPLNPFYGLGTSPILRYYYYWSVVCALPMRLFGLTARGCFNASIFWSGLGLAALIPLFLKHFLGETENLRRKSLIGIMLLTVTGLDLLPYAAVCIYFHRLLPDLEWWDSNQVASWLGSLLWVPHHVAALTACMAGLVVISSVDEQTSIRRAACASVVSGIAFASAAGLSIYVAFTFAAFATVWALWTLLSGTFKTFAAYAASGAVSVLLSLPYLSDLLSQNAGSGTGASSIRNAASSIGNFAFFSIRDCFYSLQILDRLGLKDPFLLNLSKLPILFVIYALEYGFFALILVFMWRRDRRSPAPLTRQKKMAWTLFVVSLATVSFLRSNASGVNDLGFRGSLLVQFVLLVWAVPIVDELIFSRAEAQATPRVRWFRLSLLLTALLGVAGTSWQLAAMRVYLPLADSGKLERVENFFGAPGYSERTYWLRDGFSRLNELTLPASSVQYNPIRSEVFLMHLYSTRQAIMGDENCNSAFGGSIEKCHEAFPYVAMIFNDPGTMRSWDVDALCDRFHISVLVANDTDPVWRDPVSWVWQRPALVNNPGMRAIHCGTAPALKASR